MWLQASSQHRKVRRILLLVFVAAAIMTAMRAAGAAGDAPVRYLADQKLWVLNTERTSYIVGVNEQDRLPIVAML